MMSDECKKYLEEIKFEKYLKKLKNKIKDKKVIIYGAGLYLKYIMENYDLSSFNIIGISDLKFSQKDEGKEFLGYKIILKSKIAEHEPDFVIVATLKYMGIIEDFVFNLFNNTKIKTYPLMRIPFFEMIKNI